MVVTKSYKFPTYLKRLQTLTFSAKTTDTSLKWLATKATKITILCPALLQ
jgi:hypothetical protein